VCNPENSGIWIIGAILIVTIVVGRWHTIEIS